MDSFEWGAIKNMIIVLPEYQVRVKVLWKLVDGKVLPIEAHVWEELKLVLVVVQNEAALSISWLIYQLDNRL